MSEAEPVEISGAQLRIWRDAPSLDGARTAAVGAFACETTAAGAQLLRITAERLGKEGFGAVVGPMDGDTWSAHRLVVESDGRAPFLLEPQNPDHFAAAFDEAGFDVVGRYLSAEAAVAPRDDRRRPAAVHVRPFRPDRAEEELLRLHRLSLQAFASNFLYRPISAEAFLERYRPVLPLLDPDLVLLAEDEGGELAGFLFAIPDRAQRPRPDAVVLKTYASLRRGVGSALVEAFHERAAAGGYTHVVHALMHEANLSAAHSRNVGGQVFRRYALWGRML